MASAILDIRVSAALLLATAIGAAQAQANDSRSARRAVVEPGGFINQANPNTARQAPCQPARGDKVVVRGAGAAVPGIDGALVLDVVVVTGRCRGQSGWVGSHYLTPAELSY